MNQRFKEWPHVFLPISRFCLSTSPEMIGNICKLDRDEWFACGTDGFFIRFRVFAENEGDVVAESEIFV